MQKFTLLPSSHFGRGKLWQPLLLFFLCFMGQSLSAQQTITGLVTSEEGETLVGVSIVQVGTTSGAVTDLDGNYSLTLKPAQKPKLRFSYTGFETQTVPVGNQTVISLTLASSSETLDQVVVVGYGTEKKRDVLGSIGSVDDEEIQQVTPVNTFDAIQGRIAGVQITNNGGPGAGADIRIRGTSTFSGGVNPLYVVDGQQLENIDNLDPSSIASIEVLKDGASAAIYGSKSANGVVIITTKQGTPNKFKAELTHATTFSELYSKIPAANTEQRVIFENSRDNFNLGDDTNFDSLSFLYREDIDVQEEITRMAVRNQSNLALSGGSDKVRFYWNTGYVNEQGIVINSSYQRINSNVNLDLNISEKFSAGTRLSFSYEEEDGLQENFVFSHAIQRPAYLRVRDFNGDFYPTAFGRRNPLAQASESTRVTLNHRAQLFNYLEYKILPNLSIRSTLGGNYRQSRYNEFNPMILQGAPDRPADGREDQTFSFDYQQENYLTYKRKFGKHSLTALLGNQVQKWDRKFSRLRANAFANDLIQTFNNVSELRLDDTRTDESGHALVSFYSRLSYNYGGKYLLAATIRRDGSSRFGEDRRYGNFPSVSAGWRISAEPFWDGLRNTISDFKVRAGYAVTGNERIGDYEAQFLYSPGNNYDDVNGVAPTQLANPNLGWESTEQINYGIDLEFLSGRAAATLDFYTKTTTDLLYEVPLPAESGFTTVNQNIGSVRNSGVELTLSGTPVNIGSFKWFTSLNIATNENKILDLADDDGFITGPRDGYFVQEGEALGNFYGFTNLGIFQYDESNAFSPNGDQLTPNFGEDGAFVNYTLGGSEYTGEIKQLVDAGQVLMGGDVHWKDHNGDFIIDNVNDRTVIGNGYAKVFGGFFNRVSYKGLALSVLFDYNFGNDIYRDYDAFRNGTSNGTITPHPDRILGAWFGPGDDVEYPTLNFRRATNRDKVDSYYLSSADFIKLRNIRVDYTFSNALLSKVGFLNKLSVYASVNNPITWTNYQGYNPELGSRGNPLEPGFDTLRYPSKTDVIFGLTVGF